MQTYPGDRAARQPVHTVYGGAQLFKAETTSRLGELARATLDTYGRTPADFARGVGFTTRSRRLAGDDRLRARPAQARTRAGRGLPHRLRGRLRQPPRRRGGRHAVAAAREVARGHGATARCRRSSASASSRSARSGRRAALRTLDIFLDTLLGETGGRLPDNFVVTLPKVTVAEQPRTLVRLFEILERRHGLARGHAAARADDRDDAGDLRRRRPIAAARLPRRVRGPLRRRALRHLRLHRVLQHHRGAPGDGSPGVRLRQGHDAARLRRHRHLPLRRRDQRACRSRRTRGDGADRRAARRRTAPPCTPPGSSRTGTSATRSKAASTRAGTCTRRSSRCATRPCYAFFLEGLAPAAERLRNFVEKAAQATLVGDVFDDAATGQGLLNYFLRALNCGAIEVSRPRAHRPDAGGSRAALVREDPRRAAGAAQRRLTTPGRAARSPRRGPRLRARSGRSRPELRARAARCRP